MRFAQEIGPPSRPALPALDSRLLEGAAGWARRRRARSVGRDGHRVDHGDVLQQWAGSGVRRSGTCHPQRAVVSQRRGQCRSSMDSNVTASRHTRYGGRDVRADIDMY
jgi:hypothetical protein